ncbi:hypothetical protein EGR_10415 [Echinococcus granulosus]|uniref:Uncharacterized protein n=1 Tax=Echinococcus granulosus TaxID=6210 RepID=W6UML2_ECHGR|nr:hypothetical protein EGR_10415 [Echinococcus granulosus]EUB54734.1 hypothetical protein EGR_10415 [Echinococcus granulosus]
MHPSADGACGAFRNDLTCKVHADLDDGDSVAPITNVAASVTRTQLLLAHNDDYNDPVLGTVSHTVDIWMSMNDRAAECRNGSNQSNGSTKPSEIHRIKFNLNNHGHLCLTTEEQIAALPKSTNGYTNAVYVTTNPKYLYTNCDCSIREFFN